ncbi:MAG TPA: integrin alpha [Myxococcota bacterium]|nr:integrin alpha [Myxococcota bacterium]
MDGAGDVDGDGTEDLLIGARYGGYTNNEGHADLVSGPKTSDVFILEDDSDAFLEGEAASDSFGISALGIGDVDGDSHDDLFIGASTNDDGGSQAGASYLFLGPLSGTPSADLEIDGANAVYSGSWL